MPGLCMVYIGKAQVVEGSNGELHMPHQARDLAEVCLASTRLEKTGSRPGSSLCTKCLSTVELTSSAMLNQ